VLKWTLEIVDTASPDPERSGSIGIGTLAIAWAIAESEADEVVDRRVDRRNVGRTARALVTVSCTDGQ